MDIEILSTAGFDDSDIKAIYEIDGVERVMPSYSVDLIMENENALPAFTLDDVQDISIRNPQLHTSSKIELLTQKSCKNVQITNH